jgi:ABC-2 type transport system permease protein
MNRTRALYKAFSSNLEMPKPNGEKKVKIYNRFGMIAFIGIMVPISVIVGYVTYVITDLLYLFNGNSYGLLSELDLISAFAMIFGMPLMFSILFFSSDLGFLTALPVTPASLYRARFWHTFKAENVMTSNVLFAIYIGYFIASFNHMPLSQALHPVAVIASVVGFFGSLLLPLIYCSILAMLLMLALRKLNRADIYYHTSLVLFVAFALMFLLSFRSYGKISMVNYLDTLVLSDNEFTAICNILFPTNYLTTLAIVNHKILPLIWAVLFIAALYALSVLVAHLTYRKGLFAAAVIGNKKASRKAIAKAGGHKIFASLVIKEFKVLMRTMTYRMNCVYANLLWPAAALIVIFEIPKFEFFKIFRYGLINGEPLNHVILFAVFTAMAFIASGLNSIASTSFTREGKHLDMLKYLPAPLDKQIRAKVLIAVLFTFIPVAITVTMVTISLGITVMLPLYILVSFVCILIATMIGVIMDSISPYTVWSDELSALRGNLNCFFNLAAEMVFALIVGAISYGIYLLSASAVVTISVISVLLVAAGAVSLFAGLPGAKKNIESLK